MIGITNATFTSPGWTYYAYPRSLSPIPQFMKPGMITLCCFSFLSCIATLSLMGFLAYRFIGGRNDRQTPLYKNQYMLLIFQLVLADFQCDLGFFLDVMWLHKGQIVAPSAGCWIQAWLVNVGDLGSGFFVFAIACHTFYNVVFSRKIGISALICCIVALWGFAVVLTLVPVIMHPADIFVTQGSWCSINAKYDILRLYFHYIWVFIAEGSVLVMYGTTFIVLRKRMGTIMPQLTQSSNAAKNNNTKTPSRNSSQSKISRATIYMILYPLIYVLSTLPLATGRIYSMAGHPLSKQYLVGAGTLMACGGWMNVLLYSFTRRVFLTDRGAKTQGPGNGSVLRSTLDTGIEMKSKAMTKAKGSPYSELPSPVASTDDIIMKSGGDQDKYGAKSGRGRGEGVVMQTTWDVQVEEVKGLESVKKGDSMGHRTFVSY